MLLKLFSIIAWTGLIYGLTTFPILDQGAQEEEVLNLFHLDKIVHFILFGFLAYLILIFLASIWRRRYVIYSTSILLPTVYSLFLENLQKDIPGRLSSPFDFLFSFLGILFFSFAFRKQWDLKIFYYFKNKFFKKYRKSKILLHICCAGCGAYVSQVLSRDYEVILYFDNPNIRTKDEHRRRLEEVQFIGRRFGFLVLIRDYDHDAWLLKVQGLEKEKERGLRCWICYEDRLDRVAQIAKEKGCDLFTSTLSVSPYKDAGKISEIGKKLSVKYGVNFLDRDFKKEDGFRKASQLSRELKLYRQDYCGCEFSM